MTVAVVMGSDSDYGVMEGAVTTLREHGVVPLVRVVSAHRDSAAMLAFAQEARADGIDVIIAAAGGAAHLPGMIASATTVPVIGVPIGRPHLDGLDSLLSICQMPAGVPVATMAIDGSVNAALMALRILAVADPEVAARLAAHQQSLREAVVDRDAKVQARVAALDD